MQYLGWALRNAKLRVSRKMTFVKGLLLCFDCELLSDRSPWIELSSEELVEKRLVLGCRELVELTPIDLLSRLFDYLGLADSAKALFNSYSSFLELIDDEEARTHLKELTFDDASTDETFRKVRKDVGQIFADELEKLFFNSSLPLTMITQKYGVF